MAHFATFCLSTLPPNPLKKTFQFSSQKPKILYVDNKSAKFYEV